MKVSLYFFYTGFLNVNHNSLFIAQIIHFTRSKDCAALYIGCSLSEREVGYVWRVLLSR